MNVVAGSELQYAVNPLSPDQVRTLEDNYTYHAPNGDQPLRYEAIRDKAKGFAELLMRTCPQSRELSLALTNLEQTVMWANAAIARQRGFGFDEPGKE